MDVHPFHETPSELGESPLWHDGRLFWVDIAAKRLHARAPGGDTASWRFDEHPSACGRLAGGAILLATETGLWRFDPANGERERLVALEADDAATRSNDGRADRQGGFWIGTMGKTDHRSENGRLYRYHRGVLSKVRAGVAIPNALCFSPDGSRGYFADSARQQIFTWPLDADGWPEGEPKVFVDMSGTDDAPDGAIVDGAGALWVALWGGGRLLRIGPDGTPGAEIALPVSRPTCPAVGPDGDTLFVTTAFQGLSDAARADEPLAGAVFYGKITLPGLPEPIVDPGN